MYGLAKFYVYCDSINCLHEHFSCISLYLDYTDLTMSRVTQRLSIAFTGTLGQLQYYLGQLSGDVEKLEVNDKPALRVFKAVTITQEPRMVTLEVRIVL